MALVELLANTANVLIIKAVPGVRARGHHNAGDAVDHAPTHGVASSAACAVPGPRMFMYFSCAATSLAVEVILQCISSFNHARWEGFYNLDSAERLGKGPRVRQGRTADVRRRTPVAACLAMLGNSLLAVDTVMNALVGFASLDVRAGKEALA
jgi:hypothetical protein